MKNSLLTLAVFSLLIPAMSLSQNPNPWLYLEIYISDEVSPVPAWTCVHDLPLIGTLQCYQPKLPYTYAFVPLHVAKCPNGFLGVPYGLATSGEAITYMGAIACPGFFQGVGTPPGSIYFGSIGGICQQWWMHGGYILYFNMSTRTDATYIDIVDNAEVNHHKVVNCLGEYDENTSIGIGVQWGGTQTIVCQQLSTEPTTWGKIKVLFR